MDIIFKLLSRHTKDITKINETKAIIKSSYNAWMEENMTNQHNDCDYNKVSGFFSDKGKQNIMDDNNYFFRYDPKTGGFSPPLFEE